MQLIWVEISLYYLWCCLLFQVIMHRKYLRGKRNNKSKQQPAQGKFNKMVQSEYPQVPEFLSRVANIPVVHTAYEYAQDAYGKAKVTLDVSKGIISNSYSYYFNFICNGRIPVHHSLRKRGQLQRTPSTMLQGALCRSCKPSRSRSTQLILWPAKLWTK